MCRDGVTFYSCAKKFSIDFTNNLCVNEVISLSIKNPCCVKLKTLLTLIIQQSIKRHFFARLCHLHENISRSYGSSVDLCRQQISCVVISIGISIDSELGALMESWRSKLSRVMKKLSDRMC